MSAGQQLRVRIVKRVGTSIGVGEVTLLDVPLDPASWSKKDDAALDRLEELVTRGRP